MITIYILYLNVIYDMVYQILMNVLEIQILVIILSYMEV